MDSPVLIVEAPILDDESAANAYEFLQNLMLAFDAHYYPQLQRHFLAVNQPNRHKQADQCSFDDDEIPF